MRILRFIAQALNEKAERMVKKGVERRRLTEHADKLRKEVNELVQQGSEAFAAGDRDCGKILRARALSKSSETVETMEQLAECIRGWDPKLAAQIDAVVVEYRREIAEQLTSMVSQ